MNRMLKNKKSLIFWLEDKKGVPYQISQEHTENGDIILIKTNIGFTDKLRLTDKDLEKTLPCLTAYARAGDEEKRQEVSVSEKTFIIVNCSDAITINEKGSGEGVTLSKDIVKTLKDYLWDFCNKGNLGGLVDYFFERFRGRLCSGMWRESDGFDIQIF